MRFIWLGLFLFVLLTGCGFQLRGSQDYNFDIQNIELKANNARSELLAEIATTFASQGLDNQPGAEYSLRVISEGVNRRPVASTGDISVSEYELRLDVTFQVTKAGTIIIPPTSVFVEKNYSFDAGSLVGSNKEEELVVEEMRQDAAGQILRRLQAALRTQERKPR